MTSIISAHSLCKSFKHDVLTDVSFDIEMGSVTVLLGRNGEGKTTLMNLLMGLVEPTSGTTRVFSQESQSLDRNARRRIGYFPEYFPMYHFLSCQRFLDYHRAHFPDWNDTYAQTLLDTFELPGDRKINALSLGMKIKLGLIATLAHEPDLIILDDPTLGLDPIVRRAFLENIFDIVTKRKSVTVLFSTHQIPDIEPLITHVMILNRQRILCNTPVEQLKEDHDNLNVEDIFIKKVTSDLKQAQP